ncbi:LytR/AlgR family response regulator transcription factor [Mucilaginibacter arboris]|uniref:Response regulator n=1 Tax=Mucilaginibacter arboris TaxID=2682090 RepID=A0A7K1T0K8_9SPHI|nr:LytTR family DNA-binding domain-containing protein [Mucilaginibacter arboris]MVN23057.1 response regulator [Mucilaginibacter arboris]
MMIKCIAIDDEPLALQLISSYIGKFPLLQLVQTFEDAIAGAEFLRNHTIDLLFIDINMPDITGIELVRSLQNKPMVIFTTAYKNFAFEGFELEALDYLLKPIDMKRFSKAIDKALDYYRYKHGIRDQSQAESLYVYSEYRMIKINLNDIEYIESMEDYIKIHTKAEKPVLTLMSLKKVLEKLPAEDFKRIHRSFIVAVNKIRSIQNRKVQLTTAELPVSDTYIDSIRNLIKKK